MGKYISIKDFDWVLLLILLAISALGVMQIYSATASTRFAGDHMKQVYWIMAGLVLLVAFCIYDYHTLLNHIPIVYVIAVGLLVAVLVFGVEVAGARRWFRFGGVSFQVSEPMKLIVILLLARFFGDMPREGVSTIDIVKVAVAAGIPAALILVQPDLGTSLTIVPIALVALFMAGMRLRVFGLGLLAFVLAMPVAYQHLKPYQKARLTSFMNPELDPRNSGYQMLQSKIAVGSGQLVGKGLAKGTQTQLRFLPVPHTDFIYAGFAEEHGFIGAMIGLTLYLLLLLRLLNTAQTSADLAGTYIVVGVASVLSFQLLINVGMVVGYLPITGIPLPLMSYGGTSVLSTFAAMGLVNSVRIRRFVN